ncbi:MAG: outer membrane protein assembly factor BamD [Oligoflexia bacterium]|nr:outer membrane protein assembly factor BamD [Oligoflexia bacterium]
MISKFWKTRTILLSALWTVTFLCLFSCSSTEIDNDSPPEQQYAEGERLLNKDRYIESIERFRILKSRYPYSKYAALASLRIGDAHFKEEAFLESASAYKIFQELYPKHEKVPYALFQMGESHFKLLPSTEDRDLEPAVSALSTYSKLAQTFPSSEYTAEAKKRIDELKAILADKEAYVGDFYFKRDLYESALGRYLDLIREYPTSKYREEALYRIAYSYNEMGDKTRANIALSQLFDEFPDGKYLSNGKNLEKKIAEKKGE